MAGPDAPKDAPRSAPLRNAATLVLARAAQQGRGIEVFLSRRTAKAAFMANAWVYPGGRVDDDDADERIGARLLPERAEDFARPFEDDIDHALARAHYVAALRESFEEAGVLYARHEDGRPVDLTDPTTRERLAAHRAALNRHERSFLEILEAERLVLDATGLVYFAHWITPPFESRRYDTRFFFSVLPAGQEPVPDRAELVHGEWLSPAAALDAAAAAEIQLAPPTLCTLDDLDRCDDIDAAIAWADAEIPVPILPKMKKLDDGMALLLPGDAEYPAEQPVQGPTRVVWREGRFVRE